MGKSPKSAPKAERRDSGRCGGASDRVNRDRNPRNRLSPEERLAESAVSKAFAGHAAQRQENDPGWYLDSVDLEKAYFSYPFNAPLGRTFQSGVPGFDRYSVPGVLAYYFAPTVGVAKAANDPVNVAAQRVYSFIRYANSGHANYDPTDLMIYLLAVDSLEIYANYLQRLYGVLLSYSKTNWYLPDALIAAMGVNPQDMQKHIPDLLGYIKVFVAKVSSLAVPADLSYNKRHAWMASHVWLDSAATAKSQMYLYVPEKLYKFKLDDEGAGMLQMIDIGTKPLRGAVTFSDLRSFEDLVTTGNNLLDAVISQEDFGIMSGDIMKAYPNSYRVITDITQDHSVPLLYSEEVLSQIENATVFANINNTDVVQTFFKPGDKTTAWLTSEPTVNVDTFIPAGGRTTVNANAFSGTSLTALTSMLEVAYGNKARRILNFHHDAVKESEVAVATRLTAFCDLTKYKTAVINRSQTVAATFPLEACGSEVLCGAMIFSYFVPTGGVASRELYAFDVNSVLFASLANSASLTLSPVMFMANRASQLATFDWHHGAYLAGLTYTLVNGSTSSVLANVVIEQSGAPQGVLLDADNFTWIDADNMKNMHNAALLNELWYKQAR